jgi:hypothetical protein
MLNQRSLDACAQYRYRTRFYRPAYGSYCFAHLPDTLLHAFGLPGAAPLPADVLPGALEYDRVILILADALGWRYLADNPGRFGFLKTVLANGVLSQLTSQFPSTTSAHITSINTGLPVGESGIFEWFYYEPEVDAIITPLLYALATSKERESLRRLGIPARKTLPQPRLIPALQAAGIRATISQPREYAYSTYSLHVTQGAELVPYITWSEALVNLRLLIERERNRAYYYLYFPGIDSLAHVHGPGSPQAAAEIELFFLHLERLLADLSGLRGRTLLLLTADHGMAETDPATTVYLNTRFPSLVPLLQQDRLGRPLRFGGSPRDLFLYVQPAHLAEAQALLADGLRGSAEVIPTAELIRQNVFGAASARLLERLGNLVVLPYRGDSVFWYEKGVFEQHYYGHHGGLTPEEMLIPLAAIEL